MNKKKAIIIGIGVVVVLAASAGFFLKSKQGGAAGGGPGGRGMGGPGGMQQQASATIVRVANPTTGNLSLTTGLTGTVEAADVVYVYAKASGDVTDVKVKAGDMVEQGQVLCEIDTEQVESAKNSLDTAKVRLDEAQNTLNRMKILYAGGDLSDQEYEQYTNSLKTARLSYESAKLNYDRQVEYSTVTAPIAGRIESCDVEVYDRISQQSQLCVISGEGQNRITFYVTQRMMQNLRDGDTLEVSKNGVTLNGTISEISSMVDADTGLFKVKAEVAGSDEIAIGSTVKISLVTERAENAMLVPVDAIYYSGGEGYVYVDRDGVARMAKVEVGLYDDKFAEILSGLAYEDLVVSTWSSNLYEGADIRQKGEGEEAAEDLSGEGRQQGGRHNSQGSPEGGEGQNHDGQGSPEGGEGQNHDGQGSPEGGEGQNHDGQGSPEGGSGQSPEDSQRPGQ